MTGKKVTFVIATFNNVESAKETLVNLAETMRQEDYDVILVDDSNNLDETQFTEFKNLKIYHNPQRRGVGFSLDYGIKQAQTDIVFFLGDDIRFSGDWFDRFYAVVRSHPTSLVSTVTAGLNNDRKHITGKENHYYGAHILFHVTTKNNSKEQIPCRQYIEAKWQTKKSDDIYQLPCILGAFYGCHRDWFIKIRGFEGHRQWGTLEPLCSLRSYISGGDCIIDCRTVTGHLFKSGTSNTEKPVRDIYYNKLLVASTLLPKDMEKTIYDWAATSQRGRQAIELAKSESVLFNQLADLGRNSLDDAELRRRIALTGILDPCE